MNYLWPEDGPEMDMDPAVAARRLGSISSFVELGRQAGGIFLENIVVMACLALAHLAVMVLLLAVMGVVMKASGSPWVGLIFGLVLLLVFVGPALRMISCHVALNLWDDGNTSPLEAALFAKENYFKCLFSYLWAVYYEADLLARGLPSIWPGLLVAGIVHATLHFTTGFTQIEPGRIFYFDALALALVSLPLAAGRLWPRLRRTWILYPFTAFEVVDGKSVFAEDLAEDQPGYWRGRYARLFYRLNDDWWHRPLNRSAWLQLAKNAVWILPSILILISGLGPMAKFYLITAFILTLRYALNLWFDLTSAGWFRDNISSGDYY